MTGPRLSTAIWHEEPSADDPFVAQSTRCAGYDVYSELLGDAHWADMILLLFTGERPSAPRRALLNDLAVALANPGPRDPSVNAAMSAAVGIIPAAASLTAALAAGAGQDGGGRDVLVAMTAHATCGRDIARWRAHLGGPYLHTDEGWPVMEHAAGFSAHATAPIPAVLAALDTLRAHDPEGTVAWVHAHRETLEELAGAPLSLAGLAAAAYHEVCLTPAAGEMLHLLLRLPGAAAHALEQAEKGFKQFPFPAIDLTDDPAPGGAAHA